MKLLLTFLLSLTALPTAIADCAKEIDPTQRLGIQFPKDQSRTIDFEVGKTAKELRGDLTPQEKADSASDQKVWNRLKLSDSSVKPTSQDTVLYPASGVDFGLPINVYEGAGLYIGVDIERTFTNEQVLKWADDKSFSASQLFSQRPYVSTIPYMITGDAGSDSDFGKSYLKNVVTSLPDDAVVEKLSFILDYQPRPHLPGSPKKQVGPHMLVTWCHQGKKQSSLLISAPMPSPTEGKGIWWYEQVAKLKPAYAVIKRPQGFSFDEVFLQMCQWVSEKGGMILSEGGREDNTQDDPVASCIKAARTKRHELSAEDVGRKGDGRDGKIFGFDEKAVLIEVFGPQVQNQNSKTPESKNHAPRK